MKGMDLDLGEYSSYSTNDKNGILKEAIYGPVRSLEEDKSKGTDTTGK